MKMKLIFRSEFNAKLTGEVTSRISKDHELCVKAIYSHFCGKSVLMGTSTIIRNYKNKRLIYERRCNNESTFTVAPTVDKFYSISVKIVSDRYGDDCICVIVERGYDD